MKTLLSSLLLITSIQLSLGQACGNYKVKYMGKINSTSLQFIKIKLPVTDYLRGQFGLSKKRALREYELTNHNFEIHTYSSSTCSVRSSGEYFIKEYKEKTKIFPVILVYLDKNGRLKNKSLFIPFEKIKFIPGQKPGDPRVSFDLGEIKL